jgi:hypothetical protein
MNYVQLTAQTAYQRGYQEQLEKLGFSFNPIKGLKNMFGKPQTALATQPTQAMKVAPATTQASRVPFSTTRVSTVPGQASTATAQKRGPGILVDPSRQQRYDDISRKADTIMEGYYKKNRPSMAGKPINWSMDEGVGMYPGDAAWVKKLEEMRDFNKGVSSIKAQRAARLAQPAQPAQTGAVPVNPRMLRQGNLLGKEVGNELPTADIKIGSFLSKTAKEKLAREQFFRGLYRSIG